MITSTIHLFPQTFVNDVIHNFWLSLFKCALYCYAHNYVILKSLVSQVHNLALTEVDRILLKLVALQMLLD